MLANSSIQFLKQLEKNNSKEWFDKNRKVYEDCKADFAALVNDVIKETSK